MKKFTASMLAAMCAFTSATAVFAADKQDVYYSADNSVQISDSNMGTGETVNAYKTVLIRKKPDNSNAEIVESEVVYVNQCSSGLGALSSFMLKADAEPGTYIASFGNDEGTVKEIEFEIYAQNGQITVESDNPTSEATVNLNPNYKMSVAADTTVQDHNIALDLEEGLYTKSFKFINSDTSLNRVYLVSGDGTKCYGYFNLDISTVSTGLPISYGIQLFNIDENMLDINIYLGEKGE